MSLVVLILVFNVMTCFDVHVSSHSVSVQDVDVFPIHKQNSWSLENNNIIVSLPLSAHSRSSRTKETKELPTKNSSARTTTHHNHL